VALQLLFDCGQAGGLMKMALVSCAALGAVVGPTLVGKKQPL